MIWLNRLIFWLPQIIVGAIFLWLFFQKIRQKLTVNSIRKAIILMVAVYVIQILIRIGFFYWQLKNDPLGTYLMPGKGSYFFYQTIWQMTLPLVAAIVAAIFLVILVSFVKKVTHRPLFNEEDTWIIFLTTLAVGYPNVYVLLFGSLILMVIIQLIETVRKRNDPNREIRLSIDSYLLIVALAIIILNNFAFYNKLLNLIGVL